MPGILISGNTSLGAALHAVNFEASLCETIEGAIVDYWVSFLSRQPKLSPAAAGFAHDSSQSDAEQCLFPSLFPYHRCLEKEQWKMIHYLDTGSGSGNTSAAAAGAAAWDPALLGRRCPLFGRKFLRDAAPALPAALEAAAVLRPRSGGD